MNGESLGPSGTIKLPQLNQRIIRYLSDVGAFVIDWMMSQQEVVGRSCIVINGSTRGTPCMMSHAPSLRTRSQGQNKRHFMEYTEKIVLQITGLAQVQWNFNNFSIQYSYKIQSKHGLYIFVRQ